MNTLNSQSSTTLLLKVIPVFDDGINWKRALSFFLWQEVQKTKTIKINDETAVDLIIGVQIYKKWSGKYITTPSGSLRNCFIINN